jgi:peptide/nickel transport system substrate-binding protein
LQSKVKRNAKAIALLAIVLVAGGSILAYQSYVNTSVPVTTTTPLAYVRYATGQVQNLDPHNYAGTVSQEVISQVYDGLTYFDQDLNLQPSLATSWSQVNETTWKFTLRQHVTFQDGSAWNATVAKWNFDRILDPKRGASAYSTVSGEIVGAKVVDPYDILVFTNGPFPFLPYNMGTITLYMVSMAAVLSHGESYLATHPVGTGPFEFVDWRPNDAVDLKANPSYWGGVPKIGGIMFKIMPDPNARWLALKSGDVDVIANPPVSYIPSITPDSGLQLIEFKSNRAVGTWFNTQMAPFTNINLRRAINSGIDNVAIVKYVLGGLGVPANGLTGIYDWGRLPENAFGPNGTYPYDPQAVKMYMAAAGYTEQADGYYKNGTRLQLTLVTPQGRYLNDVEMAQAIAAQLSTLKIPTTVQIMDTSSLFKAIPSGSVGFYVLGWGWDAVSVVGTFRRMFYSGNMSRAIWTSWHNSTTDKLLDEASSESDTAITQALYQQVQRTILESAITKPIYYSLILFAAQSYVHNFVQNAMEVPIRLLNLTVDPGKGYYAQASYIPSPLGYSLTTCTMLAENRRSVDIEESLSC